MKLYLFNSLTNQNDYLTLEPQQTVSIYLCGPTVYDHIHIGNLRPIIVFDVLHRFLLHCGYGVKYVHNLTDIDDKIIQKAQKEKKSELIVTQHYIKVYFQNLYNYNIIKPTFTPKVTDYVSQIQKFIDNLIKKKHAYRQENNILFRTKNNSEYGQLSKQKAEKLQSGETRQNSREIIKIDKETFQDFVLWKNTNQGTNWYSPWGHGRPGWHTECVVFIQELFGKTIDIHGGGQDLLFPHHENERIQYLAANNQELSKIWLHIGHLHWDQEKMSKSLGNVILAKHFYQKYGPNVLRYLFLNSHYNQVINFNEKLLQQAQDYAQKTKNLLKRLKLYFYWKKINIDKQKNNKNNLLYQETIQALGDNLNTIKVINYLDEIICRLNKELDEKKATGIIKSLAAILYFILDILGFKFELVSYDWQICYLLDKWQKLRQNKQFSEADQIRKQLQEKDII
ncbi:cysteine--tRNA ligase [endosymbiont GvMRE of Glomus versiforme]|uniref:cysteine--tRNA ligase n=1 Tax=endosymbiont GvMRE of Glomus versiforme TaxID=2039283 RepID=UPI000EB98D6D|nr:cysteine--tRNA ligase [endosymbiont GvMRE of Glomus versiforme]RHZ37123.1 Cysteine--tRNA ligase [endosymbiont GvMRE of Glomus versiforme]